LNNSVALSFSSIHEKKALNNKYFFVLRWGRPAEEISNVTLAYSSVGCGLFFLRLPPLFTKRKYLTKNIFCVVIGAVDGGDPRDHPAHPLSLYM
jgi:hypothetical protein